MNKKLIRDYFLCGRSPIGVDCDKVNHDCNKCEYYNCNWCDNKGSDLCENCKKIKKRKSKDTL